MRKNIIRLTLCFLFSLVYTNRSFSQDTNSTIQNEFETYKNKENQDFADFKSKILSEINNYIQQEEEWNLITILGKGNVKESTISVNDNVVETKGKKVIVVDNNITKKEVIPDYVGEIKVIEKTNTIIHPLKTNEYRISSVFGYRIHPVYKTKRFHSGMDIAAPVNTPVFSIMSGEVLGAGYVKGYGNYILILHKNGVKSSYSHLNKILVKKGEKINIGDKIGLVGKTGTATGYHLHFEIIKDNKKIDPQLVLNK